MGDLKGMENKIVSPVEVGFAMMRKGDGEIIKVEDKGDNISQKMWEGYLQVPDAEVASAPKKAKE